MRLAVYGGSFDPFHNGHLALAETLLQRDEAERVLLLPAGRSPFKPAPRADAAQRLALLRLGIADRAGLEADDREVRRAGPSYTVDTLESLHAERPGDALILVLGADSWDRFADWRDARRILELAAPLVAPRDDAPVEPRLGVTPRVLTGFRMPVSSTAVRAALAAGADASADLPPAVLRHIREHGLYGR